MVPNLVHLWWSWILWSIAEPSFIILGEIWHLYENIIVSKHVGSFKKGHCESPNTFIFHEKGKLLISSFGKLKGKKRNMKFYFPLAEMSWQAELFCSCYWKNTWSNFGAESPKIGLQLMIRFVGQQWIVKWGKSRILLFAIGISLEFSLSLLFVSCQF